MQAQKQPPAPGPHSVSVCADLRRSCVLGAQGRWSPRSPAKQCAALPRTSFWWILPPCAAGLHLSQKAAIPLENERGVPGCCRRLSNQCPRATSRRGIPRRASWLHSNMRSFSRSRCTCRPSVTARRAPEGLWKTQPRWAKPNSCESTPHHTQAARSSGPLLCGGRQAAAAP